ncbi:hypothetical protein ACWDTP_23970 [Mycobacterium sp. NPDC003449]
MADGDPADGRPVGQLILAGVGAVLLVAGICGFFGGENDEIAGGFFVLVGFVVLVLAAFYPRIDRLVDLGLLKVPAARARRAEKQIGRGQLVAGVDLDAATTALRETLSRYNDSRADGAAVLLVEDAVFTMATLTPHEQHLVHHEVVRMGRPDFRAELDPHPTRPIDVERTYRMHQVPEADIRLWYRPRSESEPDTLYLMVIEKTGEDLR